MPRTLPLLALVAVVALAGCLGSFGLGGSSDDPTTTTTTTRTEPTQTATTTTTTQTTTTQPTQTTTTTQVTGQKSGKTTYIRTMTTANIDMPNDSKRFKARVIEVVDADTVKIEHDGTTQVVDLVGIQVPSKNASPSQFEGVPSSKQGRQLLDTIHKRALQTTKTQLGNQVVTVATDPVISKSTNGRQRVYVYVGVFMYNTQLLRTGDAQVSSSTFSKRSQFLKKQQQARQKGYGIWRNATA